MFINLDYKEKNLNELVKHLNGEVCVWTTCILSRT